jgi:peptidoglycan hydrolase-like protein with peptidoglycan-binding domain
VRTWQQQMRNRGWSIGVDGDFGPQSEDVARKFQREKGLTSDGLVGAQTWAASWNAPVT